MKSVAEMFKDAAELVNSEFQDADASERLRASMAMVELMMRGIVEVLNQKRWKQGMEQPIVDQVALAKQKQKG